jgi:hypothetical protein
MQFCKDEAPLGVCGYCYEPGDEFELGVDPLPRPKPATFDNTEATQRKLLDGLDCLPGQQDLF